MALQLLSLIALGYAGYYALNLTQERHLSYMNSIKVEKITPSAFVGYDEPSNTWLDPLNVTFNREHMPIKKTEPGPYGVPRNIYLNNRSQVPLFGKNVEKI